MEKETLLEGLRFLQTNRAFLGREFLTWLWFQSESHGHVLRVDGVGEFKFYVDDKIVLSSPGGSVHENALRGGTPAYANEARMALLSGKLVQEAKFILQDNDRQWMWSMKADDLSLRGVRLPSLQEPDPAAHVTARVRLMQTLIDVTDALFKQYMALRLSPGFAEEVERMGTWLSSKETHDARIA